MANTCYDNFFLSNEIEDQMSLFVPNMAAKQSL